MEPHVFKEIIKGFVNGCAENNCALIGGETAQMPGFYQRGEYDVSGTIVGVVEKSKMLDGKGIKPGDAVIGLESSGLHTNGYSLGRQIFFEKLKLKPKSRVAELGNTIGDELLKVHVSYGPLVQKLLKKFNAAGKARTIKGLAHITGGGFVDNIPRVLPEKLRCADSQRLLGNAANFQNHRNQRRRAGRRIVSGFQHGNRHDHHRRWRESRFSFEIHSRAKTKSVADR